jgi:hypothetical protein
MKIETQFFIMRSQLFKMKVLEVKLFSYAISYYSKLALSKLKPMKLTSRA